jgi:hypothetical protein
VRANSENVPRRLEQWLREDGYTVTRQPDPRMRFLLIATTPTGLRLTVSQRTTFKDRVEVNAKVDLELYQALFTGVAADARARFLWDLRFAYLAQHVLFEMEPSDSPRFVILLRNLWYDGLTKDRFMSAVQRVVEGVTLTLWKLQQRFGSVGGTGESQT